MNWRPIETAPRDETKVLLWDGASWVVGFYLPEESKFKNAVRPEDWKEGLRWYAPYRMSWQEYCPAINSPSHWMPLPDEPLEDE